MKLKKGPLSKFYFLIPLALALLLRIIILLLNAMPFNSDEAIVALMARHITKGQLPVFFYGQAYMGSLDAILVSFGFRIFGEHVWVIRLIQTVLFLGSVLVIMVITKKLTGSGGAAVIAGLLIGLPPINVTLYTTVSLGGYSEMLYIGSLLLLGGISLIELSLYNDPFKIRKFFLYLFIWALGAGFSFWVFGLTLIFIIPVISVLTWFVVRNNPGKEIWKFSAISTLGFLLGSSPWWFSSISAGNFDIFTEFSGAAIAGVNTGLPLLKPISRFINLIVFGGTVITGLRPPWNVEWLMLPILPIILFFWLIVLIYAFRLVIKKKRNFGFLVLALIVVVFSCGFIFSPYGDDPSGRYFLPLIVPMAVFGAAALSDLLGDNPKLLLGALLLIITFNVGGTFQSIDRNPPGITTQFDKVTQVDHQYMDELIEFLSGEQITRGYTNYWVSYPLAFLSKEQIIFVPRLPYHEDFRYTSRDNRYKPYSDSVSKADDIAYITTNHEELNEFIRDKFDEKEINWKEKKIGDYQIFYQLSETLHVDDLELGETTTP